MIIKLLEWIESMPLAGKLFYPFLYWSGMMGDIVTNNYGYAPVDPDVEAFLPGQQYQIQLYKELFRHDLVSRDSLRQATIIEIGCGRGGGISYLHDYLNTAKLIGIDYASAAIRFCNRKYAGKNHLQFLKADAHDLPFDDSAIDLAYTVEATHIFEDMKRFLREIHRVLKPGGIFIIADYRWASKGQIEQLEKDFLQAGFHIASSRDITQNIVLACKEDTPRRKHLIERQGFKWLQPYLYQYAGVEGSVKYHRFASGEIRYFIYVLRKSQEENLK